MQFLIVLLVALILLFTPIGLVAGPILMVGFVVYGIALMVKSGSDLAKGAPAFVAALAEGVREHKAISVALLILTPMAVFMPYHILTGTAFPPGLLVFPGGLMAIPITMLVLRAGWALAESGAKVGLTVLIGIVSVVVAISGALEVGAVIMREVIQGTYVNQDGEYMSIDGSSMLFFNPYGDDDFSDVMVDEEVTCRPLSRMLINGGGSVYGEVSVGSDDVLSIDTFLGGQFRRVSLEPYSTD